MCLIPILHVDPKWISSLRPLVGPAPARAPPLLLPPPSPFPIFSLSLASSGLSLRSLGWGMGYIGAARNCPRGRCCGEGKEEEEGAERGEGEGLGNRKPDATNAGFALWRSFDILSLGLAVGYSCLQNVPGKKKVLRFYCWIAFS